MRCIRFLPCLMIVAGTLASLGTTPSQESLDFFERRIRPVLVESCFDCHSPDGSRLRGGLRVDHREALLTGGESGPSLVPGNPDASLLLKAIRYDDPDLQMPPRSRLSAEVVADFQRWIADGAPWPDDAKKDPTPNASDAFDLTGRRDAHWAWQPIRQPEIPAVRDPAWPAGDLDRFILSRLETAGLQPAPRAERSALLRRASFALTGLPPSPQSLAAFLTDTAPDAWERTVDALLASPHFGERWSRHWLDKVRYAETMGHEFDYPIHGAWLYRDYLVRAFNQDLPFARFTREHIAGDLLPTSERRIHQGLDDTKLATTHYWLSQQVHSPVDVRLHQAEVTDNQVDVVTKAFLGLTVSCARCHDHKFDAISTRDYYALFGILSSSRMVLSAIDDPTSRLQLAGPLTENRDASRAALADALIQALPTHPAASSPPAEPIPTSPRLREGDRRVSLNDGFPDGEAFTADPSASGQPVFIGPDAPPSLIPPGWQHSASLSTRYQGAWRSPSFRIDTPYLHFRVAGQGSRWTLALEGFTLVRAPIYGALRKPVNQAAPHWVTLDLSQWQGREAWLEFADFTAGDPASELSGAAAQPDGWIAVGAIIPSTHPEPPPLHTATPPEAPAAVVARWKANPATLTADEIAWIDDRLRALSIHPSPDLLARHRALEASLSPPILGTVMADGTGRDEPVFIRGNHRAPGPVAPRDFLEALDPTLPDFTFTAGSGRLALADAITHPDNPLFPRVTVNWVWSQLFGRGLVASVDNLGALGDPPTHPELLDWLATTFVRDGGSLKALIRRILLSETWQMSVHHPDPAAAESDPQNLLWHRAPVRRLEGEAIRDAVLAVSGRLDPTLGGPPVPVHLTPFMEGRGRPGTSGPLDGHGRRSLYLEVRRNFLSPLFLAFDAPVPFTTVGRRTVSNVPAQALTLMNDPLLAESARRWAQQLLSQRPGPEAAPDRIDLAYRTAFARPPQPEELQLAQQFLETHPDQNPSGDSPEAWTDLCHAWFNTKEFLFLP